MLDSPQTTSVTDNFSLLVYCVNVCPPQTSFFLPISALAQRPGLNMRRFLTLSFRVGGEIGVKSLFIPAAGVLIILGGLFGKALL